MHDRFRRELHALSAVFAMSEEFCALNAVGKSEQNTLDFLLEEIFTNLVKYGPTRGGEILITLDRDGTHLILSVTDYDADRFDIRDLPPPDVTLPLEERTPGGLGIYLVRQMVDRIDYDYENRTSKTTLYQKLG